MLELNEAVEDMLMLMDAIVVDETLVLEDTVVVMLRLGDNDNEMVDLGVRYNDGVGELESTDPAPTATNAIFDDCNQFVTVTGSVSPTV